MINVSFGHEKGCGAEAFFKSLMLLSKKQREHFVLHVPKNSLINYLNEYGIKYEFDKETFSIWGMKLKYYNVSEDISCTTGSLISALNATGMNDILLTLPSSKDQIFYQKQQMNGHTEFFRKFYKDANLTMNFINDQENLMLITDHIPLNKVPHIKDMDIVSKVSTSLQFLPEIDTVCISGINPHAGENGLIGTEDQVVSKAIENLEKQFSSINFKGPLPGDTLHYYTSKKTLKVYMAHDQGLSYFKGKYGINGANVTFGLPFIRLSVDHGTAFDLFGKNVINYTGSYFTLKLALKLEGSK